MKLALATTLTIFIAATSGVVHAQSQLSDGVVTVTRTSASMYPEIQAPRPAPVERACTQLEVLAGIPANECGHHALSVVVAEYVKATSD